MQREASENTGVHSVESFTELFDLKNVEKLRLVFKCLVLNKTGSGYDP